MCQLTSGLSNGQNGVPMSHLAASVLDPPLLVSERVQLRCLGEDKYVATSAANTGTLTLHTTPKRMWSNLEGERDPVEGGQDVGKVSPLRAMGPVVPSPHHS